MLSVYRTLSTRYLARRWFRAVLIVASIALGVATLIATQTISDTMHSAGAKAKNPFAGTIDLTVSGSANQPIDPKRAAEIQREVKGVHSAHARIFRKVNLVVKVPEGAKVNGTKSKTSKTDVLAVQLLGIDLTKELKNGPLKDHIEVPKETAIDAGLRFVQAFQFAFGAYAVVGSELAKKLPDPTEKQKQTIPIPGQAAPIVVPMQEFEIQIPGERGTKPVTIVRPAFNAHGPAAVLAGDTLIMDVRAASQLLGFVKETQNGKLEYNVTRIDLVAENGIEPDELKTKVEKVLRQGEDVTSPADAQQRVQDVFGSMHSGFLLCGAAALVVGLFLVYNTLAVTVAERRHEIGILLSLGATKTQIRLLFAGEAAFLGLVGALVGLPLGIQFAEFGLGPVRGIATDMFMEINTKQVELSPVVMIVACSLGILTAVAAALIPAIQAAEENPAEAVRRAPVKQTWKTRFSQLTASVALVVLGFLITVFPRLLPEEYGETFARYGRYGGLSIVLIGTLMATPLIAAVLARLVRPLAYWFMGLEGRLGADNIIRSPGRTGLVIAALAAGVSLVLQTAGVIKSNRLALSAWIDDNLGADLFVTSGGEVSVGGKQSPMHESVRNQLEQIPGVQNAVAVTYTNGQNWTYRGKPKLLFLMGLEAAQMLEADPKERESYKHFRKLAATANGAVISENFAVLYKTKVGDIITLPSATGPVDLKVIGKTVDYSWNRGTIIISRKDYIRHWKDRTVTTFDVFLEPDADAKKVQAQIIRELGAAHSMKVQTRSELKTHIDNTIERLYSIAYAQLIVVMIVASLGVVTALLISVLQRRREMGLLRAIGASQFQVIWSVLAEAALMGVIGTIIGVVVGIPIEWYSLRVVIFEETGFLFRFHFPWTEALVIGGAALGLAVVAGLGPAIYAVRQTIPEAISYE